ncbi:MAG: hypothetical protein ABEI52_11650 [Halobacteriaceae archaeon]
MSTESEPVGELKVEDEEGLVDTETKKQILNLRAQIDDDERELYVEKITQGMIDRHQANHFWSVSIRQYLRGIKRLWNDEAQGTSKIRNVERFWSEKEIGSYTLYPPDKDGYEFSIVAQGLQPQEIRRQLELPRQAEIPEPHEIEFKGLDSILTTQIIYKRWDVLVSAEGPPSEHEYVTLEQEIPIPKPILERAIETADNFLQQAGIGFETSAPDYMGGDEPGL